LKVKQQRVIKKQKKNPKRPNFIAWICFLIRPETVFMWDM
jgi:hypothetical protein